MEAEVNVNIQDDEYQGELSGIITGSLEPVEKPSGDVILESVGTTAFSLNSGESAQLQADVTNTKDSDVDVSILFNFGITTVATETATVPSGAENETIAVWITYTGDAIETEEGDTTQIDSGEYNLGAVLETGPSWEKQSVQNGTMHINTNQEEEYILQREHKYTIEATGTVNPVFYYLDVEDGGNFLASEVDGSDNSEGDYWVSGDKTKVAGKIPAGSKHGWEFDNFLLDAEINGGAFTAMVGDQDSEQESSLEYFPYDGAAGDYWKYYFPWNLEGEPARDHWYYIEADGSEPVEYYIEKEDVGNGYIPSTNNGATITYDDFWIDRENNGTKAAGIIHPGDAHAFEFDGLMLDVTVRGGSVTAIVDGKKSDLGRYPQPGATGDDWKHSELWTDNAEPPAPEEPAPDFDIYEPFEDSTWTDTFGDETDYGLDTNATIKDVIGRSGNQLEATIPGGENRGINTVHNHATRTGSALTSCYHTFKIRFDPGFTSNYTDHGKLPGFAGRDGTSEGAGGNPANGTGWSARMGWDDPGDQGNGIALDWHIYHMDASGSYGEQDYWGQLLEEDVWYDIQQFIDLGTPGENDGVLKGWIDGNLVYERTDLRFRESGGNDIQWSWWDFYHGGSNTPSGDISVQFDNLGINRDPNTDENPTGSGDAIGGGEGYSRIVNSGEYTASTLSEIESALASASSGETVYIPSSASIDVGTSTIDVPAGVTLASNRGESGSKGALIYTDAEAAMDIVQMDDGARLTGLHVRGAYEGYIVRYDDDYPFEDQFGIRTMGDNVEVDNCVISGCAYGGIYNFGGRGNNHFHHNYFYDCNGNGVGYGVMAGTDSSANPLVERNYFNNCRHCMAASGDNYGYVCRYNHFGPTQVMHVIDVHDPGADYTLIESNIVESIYRTYDDNCNHAVSGFDSTGGMDIIDNWFWNDICTYGFPDSADVYKSGNHLGEDASVTYSDIISGHPGADGTPW